MARYRTMNIGLNEWEHEAVDLLVRHSLGTTPRTTRKMLTIGFLHVAKQTKDKKLIDHAKQLGSYKPSPLDAIVEQLMP